MSVPWRYREVSSFLAAVFGAMGRGGLRRLSPVAIPRLDTLYGGAFPSWRPRYRDAAADFRYRNGDSPMGDSPRYLPSPAEIRLACREIRRGWTPAQERHARTGSAEQPRLEIQTVPVFRDDRRWSE